MKWYNFETAWKELRDSLRVFLHDNNIYYELSQAGAYFHFEIKASPETAQAINDFLDSLPGYYYNV